MASRRRGLIAFKGLNTVKDAFPEQDRGAEFFPVYHCLFSEDMLSSTNHVCSLQYYLVRRKVVIFAHTFKLQNTEL